MKKSRSLMEVESMTHKTSMALYIAGFFALALLCLNFAACDKFKHEKKDSFTYTLNPTSVGEDSNEAQTLTIEVLDSNSEAIKISTSEESNASNKRPSILLFVQHDCKNCLALAPHIVDLKQKYAKYINLFILTPASQNEQNIQSINSVLNAYAKSYPIYTPAVVQGVNNDVLNFLDKDISSGYVWLLDTDGSKVVDYAGLVPQEMVERDLLFILHDVLNAEAQNALQNQEIQDLPSFENEGLTHEHSQNEAQDEPQTQPQDSVNPADFVESSEQSQANPTK